MSKTDVQGFELDKNGFVKLKKSNADLAQKSVDNLAKENGKKSKNTKKALPAIREDDLSKNELRELIQKESKKNFNDGFKSIIKKINDTNSTHLSSEEQGKLDEYFSEYKEQVLNKIESGDMSIVNEIARVTENMGVSKSRYNFSFASKFCTYISRYLFEEYDKFMPYDQVLQAVLPYFAWAYCKIDPVKDFKKGKDYPGYIELVRAIIEKAQGIYNAPEKLTLKEFDRLLWYKYKGLPGEDLIGLEESVLKSNQQ